MPTVIKSLEFMNKCRYWNDK